MYIENLYYRVKFKGCEVVFIMSGLLVNLYYDNDLADEIEFVEVIKEY